MQSNVNGRHGSLSALVEASSVSISSIGGGYSAITITLNILWIKNKQPEGCGEQGLSLNRSTVREDGCQNRSFRQRHLPSKIALESGMRPIWAPKPGITGVNGSLGNAVVDVKSATENRMF